MQGLRTTSYMIIIVLFILFVFLLVKGILEVKRGDTSKNTIGFSGIAFFLLLIFLTFSTPIVLSFVNRERIETPSEKITVLVKVEGMPRSRPFSILLPNHTYPFIFTNYNYEAIETSAVLNDDGKLVMISDLISAWNNQDLYDEYGILLPGMVVAAEVYIFPLKDSRLKRFTPYAVDRLKIIEGYDVSKPLDEQSESVKNQINPYFP
ncbi:MAG: hypothetical protein WC939_00535 [Acholeplasmataceae bacterium]